MPTPSPRLEAHCGFCAGPLTVERMRCTSCATAVEGELPVPPLARLSAHHQLFVERFLLANGSLKQLATELGCSYPKVRRLLDGVMASLREEREASRRAKEEVLSALEAGELDGREAARRLRAILGSAP